jgi:predicted MFS family arabinose efflux permease
MHVSQPLRVTALGIAQILGWGTSFYFPAVLAAPIVTDTGWSFGWVVGGTSIGLLVAGLIAPRVGAVIDRRGGRPVLALSSLLYAAGLAGAGFAPNLPLYLLAWIVIGGGMGTGLYDAVFAALGKLYGKDARAPITNLTLFGGFASTVCWPLSAFLAESFGWRGACLIYAALHLIVSLPLQMAVMPKLSEARVGVSFNRSAATPERPKVQLMPRQWLIFLLLALVLTISAGIGSIVVVHLLIFLQARGADHAVAIALGTMFGPAQVGARVVERLFGEHYHPIWTMIASCILMALGLALLYAGFPILALAIALYGGGYGIMWVARGTLPLALFGPEQYATLMGRLAFPSLIVQAMAPSAGALLIEGYGTDLTMAVLTGFALGNVVLIGVLWTRVPRFQ